MTGRAAPPDRRPHFVFDFDHNGARYSAGWGTALGGRRDQPTEIWLQAGKAGTALEAMCRDAAVLASFALQHGARLDDLRHSITRDDAGEPVGPIGRLLDSIAAAEAGETEAA